MQDIEARLGTALPDDFEKRYRQRVAELFAADLKAVPGAAQMLAALEHPFCIASSGPPAKIAANADTFEHTVENAQAVAPTSDEPEHQPKEQRSRSKRKKPAKPIRDQDAPTEHIDLSG